MYSQRQAINQKPGSLGELVIQLHRRMIGFVRLPIQTGSARDCGLITHRFNQCATHTVSARRLHREQILQITTGIYQGGAAVKKIVGQSKQLVTLFSHQSVNRLVGIKESRLGGFGNFHREIRAAIERVVAVPHRLPLRAVTLLNKPDRHGLGGCLA